MLDYPEQLRGMASVIKEIELRFSFLFANRKKRQAEITEEMRSGKYTVWSFIFPKPVRPFFIRLGIIIAVTWIICYFFCSPAFINGESMLPTYPMRGFIFYWRPAYWFSEPERGNVVVLSFVGERYMLLKRVLAFEGETVQFRDGVFHINGVPLDEPYVKNPCDWNTEERTIALGNIYVMGDNRSMLAIEHMGGEIRKSRLKGKPIW